MTKFVIAVVITASMTAAASAGHPFLDLGDLNGDGFVGQCDLSIVLSHWGQNVTAGDRMQGDRDGDGFVANADLDGVLAGWGSGTPLYGSSSSVPGLHGVFVPVPVEDGSSPPVGFVSQDLQVVTTTDWLASNLVVNLTAGSIFQHPDALGGVTIQKPSPLLFGVPGFENLRWDTHVNAGSGAPDPISAQAMSAAGAVDLPPPPGTDPVTHAVGRFDTGGIDLNWFTTETDDTGTFTLGRFTLSSDATGDWILRLDALNPAAQCFKFQIAGIVQNGRLIVPEPSAVLLALVGTALAALGRKRERR